MYQKPTVLEKIAAHPATNVAATLLAASNPIATLLPVLMNSLAGQRQQERHERCVREITTVLELHKETLQALTDEQYHVMSEAISATFQTINPEKLKHLRNAVQNSLSIEGVVPQEASLLARIIRDISAEEADFVCRNFEVEYICVCACDEIQNNEGVLLIPKSCRESLIVKGLEILGILEVGEFLASGSVRLKFSRIAAKLLVLLKTPR